MDISEIIDHVYRSVLRRPSDESGLTTYSNIFDEISKYSSFRNPDVLHDSPEFIGVIEGISQLCLELSFSNEYLQKSSNKFIRLISESQSRSHENNYNYIIPIGNHCTLARMLPETNKKLFSLPFDWNFSHPRVILNCLEDDFETYLDRGLYRSILDRDTQEPGAHHLSYFDQYAVGDFFAHRDPAKSDEDYQYFQRCVERFRAILKSNRKKIFIMLSRSHLHSEEVVYDLDRLLGRKTNNYKLVLFQVKPCTGMPGVSSMHKSKISETCDLFDFIPESSDVRSDRFSSIRDTISLLTVINSYGLNPLPIEKII